MSTPRGHPSSHPRSVDTAPPGRAGFRPRLAINRQPGAKCGQDQPDPTAGRGCPPTVVRAREAGRPVRVTMHAWSVVATLACGRDQAGGPWAATRPGGPWAATAGGPWAATRPGGPGRDQARPTSAEGGEPGEAASPRPSRPGQAGYVHASRPPPEPSARRGRRPARTGRFSSPPRDQSSTGREVWTKNARRGRRSAEPPGRSRPQERPPHSQPRGLGATKRLDGPEPPQSPQWNRPATRRGMVARWCPEHRLA